jgi:GNAT superfamily N-acetyltransferase
LPQFVGKGLGGGLLSAAIENAWGAETNRVWVHTCSLDHPNALKNYQARGFQIYRETLA